MEVGYDIRFNHRYVGGDMHLRGIVPMSRLKRRWSFSSAMILIWLFVSILMVDDPQKVRIGPNSSFLIQPNPLFVDSVKVKELDDSKSGLELYEFYKTPSLNVNVNWSESHSLSVSHKSYKEWPYYLNIGSSLNISYTVKPKGSSVRLVVVKGKEGISKQVLNKSRDQVAALSWNLIQGSGRIGLNINESSSYYIVVANSNMKDIKVELDFDFGAVLYDTKQSFHKCTFNNGECTYNTMYSSGNYIVITTPPFRQGATLEDNEWYIMLTYEAKWLKYYFVYGFLLSFMLLTLVLFMLIMHSI